VRISRFNALATAFSHFYESSVSAHCTYAHNTAAGVMQIPGVSHTLKKWPTVERKQMDTRRFSFFLLSRPLKKAFGGKKKLPRLAIFRVRA